MIEPHLRPGYTTLLAARAGLDSDGWAAFMKDVIGLPLWMLPAVQRTVRNGRWHTANDPLRSVRESAEREAARMGLSGKPAAKGE